MEVAAFAIAVVACLLALFSCWASTHLQRELEKIHERLADASVQDFPTSTSHRPRPPTQGPSGHHFHGFKPVVHPHKDSHDSASEKA